MSSHLPHVKKKKKNLNKPKRTELLNLDSDDVQSCIIFFKFISKQMHHLVSVNV